MFNSLFSLFYNIKSFFTTKHQFHIAKLVCKNNISNQGLNLNLIPGYLTNFAQSHVLMSLGWLKSYENIFSDKFYINKI